MHGHGLSPKEVFAMGVDDDEIPGSICAAPAGVLAPEPSMDCRAAAIAISSFPCASAVPAGNAATCREWWSSVPWELSLSSYSCAPAQEATAAAYGAKRRPAACPVPFGSMCG